jgi:hypothetical protein
MTTLPMPAKIALITAGAAALFMLRFVVAHAFVVMVLAAVIAGIYALVHSSKTRHDVTEQGADHVAHVLGHGVRYMPYAVSGRVSGTHPTVSAETKDFGNADAPVSRHVRH